MRKNKAIVYLVGVFVFGLLLTAGLGMAIDQYFSQVKGDFTWLKNLTQAWSDENNGVNFVTRVIDGDTLVVIVDGREEKIRLIGIDTPESVDPRKDVECFGLEASEALKKLVENKYVRLEVDPTQSDRDKYGRWLRYVWLNEVNVNFEMIANGFAYEYTYDLPYKFQIDFKNAQKEAKDNKRGLWGECEI